MAEAREEPARGACLENELSCSICLCLYNKPVILSCGHSFCKECILKVLKTQEKSQSPYSCPMCKTQLGPILELQKNFQLCSIVETFLATNSKGQQEDGSEEEKKTIIPCDYCLDESQPAVKTCLICDASLCQAHLKKHNAKASHQDHILVEVGTGSTAEERRCQEHGKLLECYCQDEGVYICVLCSIAGEHKGHDIITMKEEQGKQLDELSKMVTWLQECEKNLATALEELQKSEQQLKTNTKLLSSHLEKLFEEMKTQIDQKKVKILSDIQSSEEKQLARISEVKEEMKKSRNEAVQHLQSLQQTREQQDVFCFFKEFKLVKDSLCTSVPGQNFRVTRMDVALLQMDQGWISCYQWETENFMSRLDTLMLQLPRELDNQIHQYSRDSNHAESSKSKTVNQVTDLSGLSWGIPFSGSESNVYSMGQEQPTVSSFHEPFDTCPSFDPSPSGSMFLFGPSQGGGPFTRHWN